MQLWILMVARDPLSLAAAFQISASHQASRNGFARAAITANKITIVLNARKGSNIEGNFVFDVADVEARAVAAAEAWDFYTTPFLDTSEASRVESALAGRTDVGLLRVDGRGTDGDGGTGRARYVFTNPDMMPIGDDDRATLRRSHCSVLVVRNYGVYDAEPWPNVLDSIGVDFQRKVGDVVVDNATGNAVAWLAVDPAVVKTCARLLPKELPGVGIVVEETTGGGVDDDDGDVWIPNAGELQDMELQRLDKRQQKK